MPWLIADARRGNPPALLSHRGIYWNLYQLQYKDQELGVPQSQVGADD
jgi:hypothetical protein